MELVKDSRNWFVNRHCLYGFLESNVQREVSYILRRHDEATDMAKQQRQDWQDLHDSIDSSLTEAWGQMDTGPQLVNGSWISVFLLKEPEGLLVNATLAYHFD